MTTKPRTLDELRQLTDDEEIVAAAKAYLDRVDEFAREARALRNAAIGRLADLYGASEAARRADVGLTTVKAVWRRT